jgi:hypothetical protein
LDVVLSGITASAAPGGGGGGGRRGGGDDDSNSWDGMNSKSLKNPRGKICDEMVKALDLYAY